MDEINELVDYYESIIAPETIVDGMDYDEFHEWVELGTKDEIECAIVEFKKSNLPHHVKIMEIYISKL